MRSDDAAAFSNPAADLTTVSGRGVVLLMVAFGLLATGLLFVYWDLHTAEFRDIQTAIVQRFPDSKPRVDGGQRKIHKNTPYVLRVTMQVQFDPLGPSAKLNDHLEAVLETIASCRPLNRFQMIETHLYQLQPEATLLQKTYRIAVAERKQHR